MTKIFSGLILFSLLYLNSQSHYILRRSYQNCCREFSTFDSFVDCCKNVPNSHCCNFDEPFSVEMKTRCAKEYPTSPFSDCTMVNFGADHHVMFKALEHEIFPREDLEPFAPLIFKLNGYSRQEMAVPSAYKNLSDTPYRSGLSKRFTGYYPDHYEEILVSQVKVGYSPDGQDGTSGESGAGIGADGGEGGHGGHAAQDKTGKYLGDGGDGANGGHSLGGKKSGDGGDGGLGIRGGDGGDGGHAFFGGQAGHGGDAGKGIIQDGEGGDGGDAYFGGIAGNGGFKGDGGDAWYGGIAGDGGYMGDGGDAYYGGIPGKGGFGGEDGKSFPHGP